LSLKGAVSITLVAAVYAPLLFAQESKLNPNLGAGVTVPVNPTARLVGANANFVVGAGYNFNKHNSIIGQFMWAGFTPTTTPFGRFNW
jgi:hypothetical protein